jgi:uncharacterized protein (TIGR03435 family)
MRRMVPALLLFACCAWGQSFEVASIRLHTARVQRVAALVSGQRFTAEAMSLDNLITYAYDVKRYQVFGVPGWADSNNLDCDRYDVSAKAEADGTLSQEQAKAMLRNLLAERFHLKFHRDMKEMPVYALVVAKDGHKLNDAAPDARIMMRMSGASKGLEMTVTAGTIAQLVNQFSNANGVDRPVLDRTGLAGSYDYKLTWSPSLGATDNGSEAVSIFTALQEQLGLRLEPQRAPIEILVIDNAEKPTEN